VPRAAKRGKAIEDKGKDKTEEGQDNYREGGSSGRGGGRAEGTCVLSTFKEKSKQDCVWLY
jgi:hypothetical protein